MIVDIIVIGLIVLGLSGALFYNIRSKKNGNTGCSSCSGCTVSNCNSKK